MPQFDPGLSLDGVVISLVVIAVIGVLIWLIGGEDK